MASQGVGGLEVRAENTERPVVRLAEWLRKQQQPISEDLWSRLVEISQQTRDRRAQLKALAMLADRIDPISQPVPIAASAAGVHLTIQAAPDAALPHVQADGWTLHLGGSNGRAGGDGDAR